VFLKGFFTHVILSEAKNPYNFDLSTRQKLEEKEPSRVIKVLTENGGSQGVNPQPKERFGWSAMTLFANGREGLLPLTDFESP